MRRSSLIEMWSASSGEYEFGGPGFSCGCYCRFLCSVLLRDYGELVDRVVECIIW
jgi:hypothetical protein